MKRLILGLLLSISLFGNDVVKQQKACDNGDAVSCYTLANMYNKGEGVKKSHKKAFFFYKRACEIDKYGEACYNLAHLYIKGRGIKEDKAMAKEYYGQACDNEYEAGCKKYAILNIEQ